MGLGASAGVLALNSGLLRGKRPSDLDIDYDTSFMDLPSEYQVQI